jgi:glycosyltransferase involved in cell wall biosynthesis
VKPGQTPVRVVAHLTTVHPADDVRIFVKECRSLASAGYEVHLVAPGTEDGVVDGVHVHGLPPRGSSNRLGRMTGGVARMYRMARALDADVYHFHDPELIPAGLLLRAGGKQVIYDAHENLPEQVLTKPWIPAPLRRPLGLVVDWIERLASRAFSGVIAAAPHIERRFAASTPRTATLSNYPLMNELAPAADWSSREHAVCYAGSVTEIRGVREMVGAIARTDATLLLAGAFNPPGLERELESEPGWSQVVALGQVGAAELARVMARSRAGLVVLRAVPRYVDARPTKLFDYMSAGIPAIASDFPGWRAIVERHECGVCVDPADPQAIADAIEWLLANPEAAHRMGQSGRRAVEQHYNWEAERAKLLRLYSELAWAGAPTREADA